IWPKRMVSWIDYKDSTADNCKDDETKARDDGKLLTTEPTNPDKWVYPLGCTINANTKLEILVAKVSSSLAESFDTSGNLISSKFQNDL
ncbi:hypothetical protein ACJBYZ_10855, partial [Streptococcus suis]